MKTVECKIDGNASVPFNNQVDFCIGTGRMGLALQRQYYEQLKLVQEKIGFKYIRGHGLFYEDLAIYNEYVDENGETKAEYNFTYLDVVMDMYKELGLKPFLEIGFMPKKLASSSEEVGFWWRANVTPPKSYESWCELVTATISHLAERYGLDEVKTWYFEIWNEPNLQGFWKDADLEKYCELYKYTVSAIKAVSPDLRVGGPAICGVDDERWMRSFLEYTDKNDIPLDFITRHHYTIHVPETVGHYQYPDMIDRESADITIKNTRKIVDSFEKYRGFDIHLTEFNTSYSPITPLHDTNMNAAYLAGMLAELGDIHASYSYWTFGDVFEEHGVPFTPFHGGFGLVANGCIPKPPFHTFKFFKRLTGRCNLRSKELIVTDDNGKLHGVAWNSIINDEPLEDMKISASLDLPNGEYCLLTKTVDEEVCNPRKLWHDIGEPANPTPEQNELLRSAAYPLVQSKRLTVIDGKLDVELNLSPNAVMYFEIFEAPIKSDRGFEFERINRTVKSK